MKLTFSLLTLGFLTAAFFLNTTATAQRKPPKIATASTKPAIFAVMNDGKWIDPIGVIDEGELKPPGEDDQALKAFGNRYYKPKSVYSLVFGGAAEGTVTVTSSNIGSECGGPSAEVTLKSTKVRPSGLVWALASDVKQKPDATGYRRRPTPSERTSIEMLVREEFKKNGASAAAVKVLHFHNLTAVDVEGDDVPDFVGSYWIAPTTKERRLLFFIAEQKGTDIKIVHSDHSIVTADDIMSGDFKDVEAGRGAEILVDLLDYDGNGVREIFTVVQAFEGNNYYAYKRQNGKWTKVFETYNYRCAY